MKKKEKIALIPAEATRRPRRDSSNSRLPSSETPIALASESQLPAC